MLILKCDDVHVTTMEFLERFVYSRLFIVNKALASGLFVVAVCCSSSMRLASVMISRRPCTGSAPQASQMAKYSDILTGALRGLAVYRECGCGSNVPYFGAIVRSEYPGLSDELSHFSVCSLIEKRTTKIFS